MNERVLALTVAAILSGSGALSQQAMIDFSSTPAWPANGDVSRFPASQYVFSQMLECTVAIRSSDGNVGRILHAPRHRFVLPQLATEISRDAEGRFHYSYVLTNEAPARMPIRRWAVAIEEPWKEMTLSHPAWGGGPVAGRLAGIAHEPHTVVQWQSPDGGALPPGQSLAGFEIVSNLAPGFVPAVFYGVPSIPELASDDREGLPPTAETQLDRCLSPAADSGSVAMIGPRFSPGAPAEWVYPNFLSGIRRMRLSGKPDGDSQVLKELESMVTLALTGSEPITREKLDTLGRAAKAREAETVSAMKLILEDMQAK